MTLKEIVEKLRKECPWDRKQTLKSIKHLYIEESYELAEALESGDGAKIEEELGDLLYVVLMGVQIASDAGLTDYEGVEATAAKKLVRRHPHVFSDAEVDGEGQVLANWERIKEEERQGKGKDAQSAGFFSGIPKSMPALIRSQMMQERAARVGFDWPSSHGPLEKIHEEARELSQHLESGSKNELEHELGDLLFSVVNVARHTNVRAEDALARANRKFERRFEGVRKLARDRNLDLAQMNIEELDKLWDEVKEGEN